MRSMTGCGKGTAAADGREVTVELRSVNHRFLDVACRLPRDLAFLEDPLRKALAARLKRGHVDVYVTARSLTEGAKTVRVDEAMAASYRAAAAALAPDGETLPLADLMRLEGVLLVEDAAPDEEAVLPLFREAVGGALDALCAMSLREGENLRADLKEHLDRVEDLREKILARAPAVPAEYRERLTARLSRLPIEPVDPARLAQEVALMADKCAVDEELARLKSHVGQMRAYLDQTGEVGKKMDFLIQEMNREANTIGSKANDAAIAQWVVDLKSEIEKLREQVQNVE